MGCKNCSDVTLLSGEDGNGIQTIVDNGDGTFTIFMTDGSTFTTSDFDGTPGAAATIAVGTSTTGIPGTNAIVSNSGSSAAAVFDFTIPRGDSGAVLTSRSVNIGTPGDYQLNLLNDFPNKFLYINADSSSASGYLTLPSDSSQAIPVGYKITAVQIGATSSDYVTLAAGGGGSIIKSSNDYLKFTPGNAVVEILKIATNTWAVWGDLIVV